MSDTDQLEKYAREKYLMKKDNEDLFIIEEEVADTSKSTAADTIR